jgi:16S rRNA (adenine1518-N6/adenine1519-N6)-dimethyltransferase
MNLSDMRRILEERGIQLTRSLGQNFLHDTNQLRKIADAAKLAPTDKIIEIGPGLGPLTELLLARSERVLALEMDERLVKILRARFESAANLELIHADALAWIRQNQRDWSGWKLVSNLPYSVASPILVDFAEMPAPPESMTVTLQLEVAERLQSTSADDDYGLLTLLVQIRYEPIASFKIPAASFFPAPDVDSACISLKLRDRALLPSELLPKFKRIAKKAFSERRKMMLKLLKQEWPEPQLSAAFQQLSLSPQIRAEKVSLQQFVELTKLIAN